MANSKSTTSSLSSIKRSSSSKKPTREDNDSEAAMSSNNNSNNNTTYSAGFSGLAVKRIRTPHAHDVLSGRGGGINGHEGNIQFRAWVAERKNDYNLAPNKAEKARVAHGVIALVKNQNPPGRFLQKDPTAVGAGSWWVEVDEDKMMAKTSQALREGAPLIRAAHKDELAEQHDLQKATTRRSRRKTTPKKQQREEGQQQQQLPDFTPGMKRNIGYVEPDDVSGGVLPYDAKLRAMAELQANMQAATTVDAADDEPGLVEAEELDEEQQQQQQQQQQEEGRAAKRVRVEYNGQLVLPTDATPPLTPVEAPKIVPLDPTLIPEPLVMKNNNDNGLKRVHSLALSDMSYNDWNHEEEFVNPFEDDVESQFLEPSPTSSTRKMPSPPRPGLLREQGRQSSITSDMGGYGALLRSYDAASKSSSSSSSLTSDLSQQQQQQCTSRQQRNNNIATLSSRSLTSVLSDLPDAVGPHHVQDTDFSEGMKTIYDALHPDVDEDAPPSHCIPYRTKNFRRLSGNLINRIHLGRAGAQPQ